MHHLGGSGLKSQGGGGGGGGGGQMPSPHPYPERNPDNNHQVMQVKDKR